MKKRFQLLSAIIITLLLFSCGKECYEGRVAIMYAFDAEGQLLRNQMSLEDSLFSVGRVFWIGKIADKEVIVVNSDVGMTNAAMTTQLLIDRFKPKQIIFTGICGGIDPENQIGDIVIPELWVTHDYGLYDQKGFSPYPIRVHQPQKEKSDTLMFFPMDESLLRIAENVKVDLKPILGRTPKIKVGGKGSSGNSFIDQVEKREWLKERLDAQIVDMESAAVVQVAKINGVPILVVRSCSDLAGGSGSSTAKDEIQEFFEKAADNSANFVLEFLKQL
ncbi:MAG: 5'-methylthioadenosine/S-adenosylhomocysteine nucleosidase [candidate division Zixibacteria bacterium]|nr:5'-methylthioadenosine/S-adenosylhomocysteine nucleosidase [candidate division Zixibacteria bacterium]